MHPVRARKVRYYEDPQFQRRILKLSGTGPVISAAQPDDWSDRTPISPSTHLLAALKRSGRDGNGGIRREPELPQQDEVVITAPSADNEFDAMLDDGDADAAQVTALNPSTQGLARSISLDPDDKMRL